MANATRDDLARQRWSVLTAPEDPVADDDDEASPDGGWPSLTVGAGDDWGVAGDDTSPNLDDGEGWWQRAVVFGREHVAVVVVALVVGLVFAVMTFLHTRPQEVPLAPLDSPVAVVSEPAVAEPPVVTIKVHVLGAVRKPGVVALPDGSRVDDAIRAAGGLSAGADPAQLNLAAVLVDGAQIIIGTTKHPQGDIRTDGGTAGGAGGSGTGATSKLVNLNTASQAELESLPGIGPVTAQKILTWRTQHGRFSKIAELQEIDGIGPKTMAQLEPYVCV